MEFGVSEFVSEFGVLGPLHARIGGREVTLNGPRQARLLAALLVDANRVVPMERLSTVMWDGDGPATAVRQVQDVVSGLRRNLSACGAPPTLISTHRGGYRIQLATAQLDLTAFEQEREQARHSPAATAAAGLRRALACWRGPALADLTGRALEADAARLNLARTTVHRECLELELALGRHREVVEELTALLRGHPHDERLAEQAMLALYRDGRQGQALEVYRSIRRRLADDLGVDPTPPLRELQRRILNADPSLAPPPRAAATAAVPPGGAPATPGAGDRRSPGVRRRPGVRCQLPADTRLFTGRARELEELLLAAGDAPGGSRAGMVVISAIDGMGGVGKSALAVHAAHRVRHRFPDGQFFLDLHGHTPGSPPLPAADALGWLLRSLGVPAQRIPQDLGERAALYRDRIADTRTLIVLDNAASSAQVRPLLPGTPGCLVLVTSRKRLTGLDDAHLLPLDVLPRPEAVALLHEAAGPGRIPEGHPGDAELVARCGHLPLAIRITAARLRHDRTLQVEDLVDQLRDEQQRLSRISDEERSLSAVFDTSFTALPPAEQELFRHLGRFPGPDFDAYAAANLLGTDHRTAERLLESLLDHSLLIQHSPGRYRFHDLVGLYARGMSEHARTGAAGAVLDDHATALDRLSGYYLHTARLADHHLARRRSTPAVAHPAPATAPRISDRATALTWLRAERDNLLAQGTGDAARTRPAPVIALIAALAAFLLLEGLWTEATELHRRAADAARRLGDPIAEAGALCDLGRVQHATGNYQASAELYEQALTRYQGLGDRRGEATGLHELGRIRVLTGDYPAAAELHERALAIFRALGDRPAEARTLCDLGRARHSTGDSPAAVGLMEHVLTIHRDLGDRRGEAGALHDLGYVLHEMGDHPAAAELHQRALTIYRQLGSRQGEATALWSLGRARHEMGDHGAAVGLFESTLTICREIGSRQSEADALHGLGRAQHALQDLPAAALLYRQALALYREIGSRPGEAALLTDLAALVTDTTGPRDALPLYRQALDLARLIHSPRDEARALDGLAHCSALLGDPGVAVAALRRAVALYQRLGAPDTAAAVSRLSALQSP
ncbi:tetratricopeptide repeat protein [Kitasatospora sp. NPDC008050]|uniref:AfsR/SARP family transcriptional regulator n=1 Tax=Kitasatospora sp. NPDC008050 TaxID=3364021 RepID=UPI0036E185D5